MKIFQQNEKNCSSFLYWYCYNNNNRIYCENANIVASMGIDETNRLVECKFSIQQTYWFFNCIIIEK